MNDARILVLMFFSTNKCKVFKKDFDLKKKERKR